MSCVVLHATESDPGTCNAVALYLVRMGYESHEVFDPSCGDLVQLLPPTAPGQALVNLPGGVETNRRGGVYQIEIVGRAVDVPTYSDAWYRCLYERLELVCDMTQTPLVFPLPFEPYPKSYGRNLVRMTYDEWNRFEGICGHQHVPENDHGDPGALDVARLHGDDDMTPEQFAAMIGTSASVRSGVVGIDLKKEDGSDDGWWPFADVLEFTHRHIKAIAEKP
jgi:hypothetical protein